MTDKRITPVMVPVSVVGLQQRLYGVGGDTVGLEEAMHQVELDIVSSLEKLARDSAKVVKLRTERLRDLNRALTLLTGIRTIVQTRLKGDETYSSPEVGEVFTITSRLQVPIAITGSSANNAQVTKSFAQINNAIEDETNRLQQVAASLRNYMSQRDRHFARLDTVVRKISGMPDGTVRNIG